MTDPLEDRRWLPLSLRDAIDYGTRDEIRAQVTDWYWRSQDMLAKWQPRLPDPRFFACSNPDCPNEIDVSTRRRAPLPTQKAWCDSCRVRGVPKRDSERCKREQARLARREQSL